MLQNLIPDQPGANEEQEQLAQIEEVDIETLKVNFKQMMAAIVTAYGDNEEASS